MSTNQTWKDGGLGETSGWTKPRTDNPELAAQLAENMKQVDFVQLLRDHNVTSDKLYAKILGDKNFEVTVPFKGSKGATYSFKKPPIANEEYILFQEGYVSEITNSLTATTKKNYDSKTGTWAGVTTSNDYANAVNSTMTVTFTGTGLDFQHYADNRGGIWEFVVDGDTANKVTVSTWDSVIVQFKTIQIARNLTQASHTVVATFKGDDPLHVPSGGAGTSRGWIKFNSGAYPTLNTFLGYETALNNTKKYDVLRQDSNKEFALRLRPAGSGLSTEFVPGHVSTATTTTVSQKIYFDNVEITGWTPDSYLREVKSIQVVQKMLGKHPQDIANPMVEFYSIHTITSKGVSVKIKVKFLRDLFCTTGYGLMFPVKATFAKKLFTSFGNAYDSVKTDGSETQLTDNDKAISYAFLNTGGTNGEPDVVVAMTVQNIYKSFRYGKTDRRNPLAWLQHRDADLQKLYTQSFLDANILAGETFEVGGTFFIGELPYAIDILI